MNKIINETYLHYLHKSKRRKDLADGVHKITKCTMHPFSTYAKISQPPSYTQNNINEN